MSYVDGPDMDGPEVESQLDAIRMGQFAERQKRAELAQTAPGATRSVLRAKLTGVDNNRN